MKSKKSIAKQKQLKNMARPIQRKIKGGGDMEPCWVDMINPLRRYLENYLRPGILSGIVFTLTLFPIELSAFTIGGRVQATANLNVRSCASTTCSFIVTVSAGATGTILSGPTSNGGYTWWQVGWDVGKTGYSVQDYLTSITMPIPAAPSNLVAIGDTNVIRMLWTDNATNESGFKIERKTGVSGTYSQIAIAPAFSGNGTTSSQDAGLTYGNTYCYRIRATNATGDSSYSNAACGTTLAIPVLSSPNDGASFSANYITLQWGAITGATAYKVEVAANCNGTNILTNSATASPIMNVTGLANGTYAWRVQATNLTYPGLSNFSGCRSFTVGSAIDTTKPVVSAFSVTAAGSPFTISYTVLDSGGSGLKYVSLWRAPDTGGVPGNFAQINTNSHAGSGPVSNSFSDSPTPAGTYWYGIHVADNAGNWTSEPNPPGPIKRTTGEQLSAPSSLVATGDANRIRVVWTDNTTNETGFKIERKTGGSGTFSQISTAPAFTGTGTTYMQDSGLAFGTAFCYRVKAFNTAGDSSYSNEACGTTLAAPALVAPDNAANYTVNYVTIQWGAITGATAYNFELSASCGGTNILGAHTSSSPSYIVTGLANGLYYWRAQAANVGASPGLSSFSGCRTFTVNAPVPLPDLSPLNLNISSNTVNPGNTVVVNYTIKNLGSGSAGQTSTKIAILNANSSLLLEQVYMTSALEAGVSTSESHTITIPQNAGIGKYTILVLVDNSGVLHQNTTANDMASTELTICALDEGKLVGKGTALSSTTVTWEWTVVGSRLGSGGFDILGDHGQLLTPSRLPANARSWTENNLPSGATFFHALRAYDGMAVANTTIMMSGETAPSPVMFALDKISSQVGKSCSDTWLELGPDPKADIVKVALIATLQGVALAVAPFYPPAVFTIPIIPVAIEYADFLKTIGKIGFCVLKGVEQSAKVDGSDRRLAINTTSPAFTVAGLIPGSTYTVVLQAVTESGVRSAVTSTATIFVPPTVSAITSYSSITYNALYGSDGRTLVRLNNIPVASSLLLISTSPAAFPLEANPAEIKQAMLSLPNTITGPDSTREFVLFTGTTVYNGSLLGTITLPYSDQDGDGFVDGSAPLLAVDDLQPYELINGHWVPISGPVIKDTARQTLTFYMSHLAVYTLSGPMSSSVPNTSNYARVFPNPWHPTRNDRFGSSTIAGCGTGLIFNNLASRGIIRIYSIQGDLVRELNIGAADNGCKVWDGRNSVGRVVASGIYVAVIKTQTSSKNSTEKMTIAIER